MCNIWLIDDDQAAHVYHKIMIRQAGLDLEKVQSFFGVDESIGELITLNQLPNTSDWPRYIFLDINMPLKSGYAFVDEFCEINLHHHQPEIYFVSSTKNPEDIEKYEQLDSVKGFETKFLDREFFERLVNDSD